MLVNSTLFNFRESAVSTAQDQWVPQVRSIAVSASFEEIIDPDPKEELNYSERVRNTVGLGIQ